MTIVKRWQLAKSDFDHGDYLWLKKYAHHFDIKQSTETFTAYGRDIQFTGKTCIYVQTITQAQENMLQLKYGNGIFLLQIVTVAPGHTYHDEYGTITSF